MSVSESWMDDATHPAQIALRTYALSLSLSLGPSLVPFAASRFTSAKGPPTSLKRVLGRELAVDGFAFAVTLSVAGGAAIRRLWSILGHDYEDGAISLAPLLQRFRPAWRRLRASITQLDVSSVQKTFLSNILSSSIGIILLQAGRQRALKLRNGVSLSAQAAQADRTSPTLDLTLLLLVRAVDSVLQNFIRKTVDPVRPKLAGYCEGPISEITEKLLSEKVKQNSNQRVQTLTSRIDGFVFWACSARYVSPHTYT
jgi:hypothetical protein